MASTSRSKDKVTESLSNLTLDTAQSNSRPSNPKSKKKVLDSWEDDDESSGSDIEQRTPAVASPVVPSAPPPTPFAANYKSVSVPGWNDIADGRASPRGGDASKRPEKTDAVARRMIAAGLGLKAPKQTEEQRAFQKSVREQEKKKRDQAKEDEQRSREESEKAKAAVWED
ncbi:hypothetical protein EsHS_00002167 [Epichloe bromicola]